MLKRLFTSKVRIKLLQLFLSQPDTEFFIRQLTRKLDEQINSVRRELDNLKKVGLLTSKSKNRKKYYITNKHFMLYNELKSIMVKGSGSNEELVEDISKLGKVDLLIFSGIFLNKDAESDILLVGDVDKDKLSQILESFMEKPIKFTVLNREDFLYRLKCNDRFISKLVEDTGNIFAINKLDKYLSEA